ncbi:MAG TPA: hypothetical protein DEP05_04875 [Betaproteobacteria bacterium]|nr:hypothetical protein [Betaproteobacteria bacterium]
MARRKDAPRAVNIVEKKGGTGKRRITRFPVERLAGAFVFSLVSAGIISCMLYASYEIMRP